MDLRNISVQKNRVVRDNTLSYEHQNSDRDVMRRFSSSQHHDQFAEGYPSCFLGRRVSKADNILKMWEEKAFLKCNEGRFSSRALFCDVLLRHMSFARAEAL